MVFSSPAFASVSGIIIYPSACCCDALLRIGEADTECIIRLDTALCGTGRGDLKDTVLLAQLSYCDTGAAGGTSQKTIDSLIHQCIVCLNSFIFGCLIVLKSKLKFISILANLCSTCIVDLLNGDLRSLFYRGSIRSCCSCQRTASTKQKGLLICGHCKGCCYQRYRCDCAHKFHKFFHKNLLLLLRLFY